MLKKKRKQFKTKKKRKNYSGLFMGAIAVPITLGLASKGASKLGDLGAGIEKGVGGFTK